MAGEAATISPQALLLLLIPLILLLVGGKRWRRRRSKQRLNLPLPPSPPGKLPVIGHLHLVGSLPHVSFRDLARKHGRDLMLLRLGAVNTVVVSSPRAAKAVLRTHDHALASRARSAVADIILYGSSDVGFAPYGGPWRQARKVVKTHMLSATKVHSFRHDREEEARIAVAKIRAAVSAAGTAVDMSEHLGSYANDVVCRAVLGRHHGDDGRNKLLRELVDISLSLLGGFNAEDYFPGLAKVDVFTGLVVCPRAKKVHKRWDELLDRLIDEHGRHRDEQEGDASAGFIHDLLSLQQEYGLTTDNVKAILIDMFDAGIETTYLVLEFAMAELMNNRRVMAKLQDEVRSRRRRAPAPDQGEQQQDVVTEDDLGDMAHLRATVKETLRLHPPAPLLIPHFSIADSEIDGYTIPAGTRLMVNVWALARDPVSWEAPEMFAPERFLPGGSAAALDGKGNDFQFLPFGSGRRICPGINFANTAVEMLLANLLYNFDWELPAEKKEVDMKEVFSLSIRRKEKLLLVPIPRSLS